MKDQAPARSRMSVRSALGVLAAVRDDTTIVVTNQGSARVWPRLADHPLDFHYNPSTMGGALSFGLGLALAKPSHHVLVISGDGALTMNLGSLITVAAAGPANLTAVVLDNGIYEVTGGQRTAADEAQVDYVMLGQSVGFRSTFGFVDEISWRAQAPAVLAMPGPRLISLRVDRADPADMATSLAPITERLARLAQQIAD